MNGSLKSRWGVRGPRRGCYGPGSQGAPGDNGAPLYPKPAGVVPWAQQVWREAVRQRHPASRRESRAPLPAPSCAPASLRPRACPPHSRPTWLCSVGLEANSTRILPSQGRRAGAGSPLRDLRWNTALRRFSFWDAQPSPVASHQVISLLTFQKHFSMGLTSHRKSNWTSCTFSLSHNFCPLPAFPLS